MFSSQLSQMGTILLIDDEAIIRTAVAEYLELTGYSVLVAEDGEEGLEIFQKEWPQLALVLLDVSLPNMSGTEVLAHIRELTADMPIIILSGLNETDVLAEMGKFQPFTFMKKPFRLDQLIVAIKDVIRP
jgi:DNA-binding NtrC family response regulator